MNAFFPEVLLVGVSVTATKKLARTQGLDVPRALHL